MRRSRYLILSFAILTIICILPPTAGTHDDAKLRMAVWGMPFEDALFRDGYAREFEQMHPGLTIKYEKYVDVTDKYLAWHILGTGADVMRVPITDYHTLVSRGVLEPLDAYLNHPEFGLSEEEQADFTPAIWQALLVGANRYALPSDNAQYGLFYNKGIFDAYNSSHPDAQLDYPNAEWTWSDLRMAAEMLTERDGQGRVVRYGLDFDLWPWPFMTFFVQAGGELWDEEQTTTLIDSEAGVEALQFIVDVMPHAGAMRSADVKDSATGPDKLFAAGRTAMLLDGSWRAPFLELVNEDLDFAISPLPSNERSAVVSGSVLWAVNSHSKNKELAWRMIRWMTSFEQSLRYWDMLRVAPPARISVIESEEFRETKRYLGEDGRVLASGMPREDWDDIGAWLLTAITPDPATGEAPGFIPVAPYQKDLEDKINSLLSRAIAPHRNQSLEELLREATDEVHRIIDRDRRARGMPAVVRQQHRAPE